MIIASQRVDEILVGRDALTCIGLPCSCRARCIAIAAAIRNTRSKIATNHRTLTSIRSDCSIDVVRANAWTRFLSFAGRLTRRVSTVRARVVQPGRDRDDLRYSSRYCVVATAASTRVFRRTNEGARSPDETRRRLTMTEPRRWLEEGAPGGARALLRAGLGRTTERTPPSNANVNRRRHDGHLHLRDNGRDGCCCEVGDGGQGRHDQRCTASHCSGLAPRCNTFAHRTRSPRPVRQSALSSLAVCARQLERATARVWTA